MWYENLLSVSLCAAFPDEFIIFAILHEGFKQINRFITVAVSSLLLSYFPVAYWPLAKITKNQEFANETEWNKQAKIERNRAKKSEIDFNNNRNVLSRNASECECGGNADADIIAMSNFFAVVRKKRRKLPTNKNRL